MDTKLESQVCECEVEISSVTLEEIEHRENSAIPSDQTIWCCVLNVRF